MSLRSTLVVRPYDPRRRLLILAVVLILIVLGGWQLVKYGESRSGLDFTELREQNRELLNRVRSLEEENRELRHQVAYMARSDQIHQQAEQDLRRQMSRMQHEIHELRSEVGFYRGIVSPGEGSSGLQVQKLELRRAGAANSYYYRLVLIQALRHEQTVSGTTTLVAHGERGGDPVTLTLSELSHEGRSRHEFSFRYFQDFDGMIVFPEGFVPDRLEVSVNPRGRQSAISREFRWSALTG